MNESEIRILLEQHDQSWDDFLEFMAGNTVGVNEDDSINYYETDVWRFLE